MTLAYIYNVYYNLTKDLFHGIHGGSGDPVKTFVPPRTKQNRTIAQHGSTLLKPCAPSPGRVMSETEHSRLTPSTLGRQHCLGCLGCGALGCFGCVEILVPPSETTRNSCRWASCRWVSYLRLCSNKMRIQTHDGSSTIQRFVAISV